MFTFLMLLLQLLCLLTFWLLLRQTITEKRAKQKDKQTQLSTITVNVEGKIPIFLPDHLSHCLIAFLSV